MEVLDDPLSRLRLLSARNKQRVWDEADRLWEVWRDAKVPYRWAHPRMLDLALARNTWGYGPKAVGYAVAIIGLQRFSRRDITRLVPVSPDRVSAILADMVDIEQTLRVVRVKPRVFEPVIRT